MRKEMDFKGLSNAEGKVLVSVYGTLKQGWGNHSLLSKDPKFVGSVGIDTLDGVGFPIIKLGDAYELLVEVYEVDEGELLRLDGLEGYRIGHTPTFYERKQVEVTLEDGTTVNTYIYEYVSPVVNNIDNECTYNEDTGVYTWVGQYR